MNVSEGRLDKVVFPFITVDELYMHPGGVVEALIFHLFALEDETRLDELGVHTGEHLGHGHVGAHAMAVHGVGTDLDFVDVLQPVSLERPS